MNLLELTQHIETQLTQQLGGVLVTMHEPDRKQRLSHFVWLVLEDLVPDFSSGASQESQWLNWNFLCLVHQKSANALVQSAALASDVMAAVTKTNWSLPQIVERTQYTRAEREIFAPALPDYFCYRVSTEQRYIRKPLPTPTTFGNLAIAINPEQRNDTDEYRIRLPSA